MNKSLFMADTDYQHGSFTAPYEHGYISVHPDPALTWTGAHRIINGTDKANLTAGYTKQYYAAISY